MPANVRRDLIRRLKIKRPVHAPYSSHSQATVNFSPNWSFITIMGSLLWTTQFNIETLQYQLLHSPSWYFCYL